MALAGVATPAAKQPLNFARAAHDALVRSLDDCAADAACRGAFPNLKAEFDAVLTAFDNGPVTLEMLHPVSKVTDPVSMSRGVFVERLPSSFPGPPRGTWTSRAWRHDAVRRSSRNWRGRRSPQVSTAERSAAHGAVHPTIPPLGLTTLLGLGVVTPLVAVVARDLIGTVEASHLSALVAALDAGVLAGVAA